jgi:predicted enzyme related to lactoylglutathione lyase
MTNPASGATRAQPESFRARAVAASLTSKDLARSIKWYTEVLGWTVGDEWKEGDVLKGVTLKAGDVEMHVSQDDFKKGKDRVVGIGISLNISTVQDVDELAARITNAGGKLDAGPMDMPWGARLFSLTDPDGFKLSIFSTK